MPRATIPIRAPFGGLISNPAYRNVGVQHCVDCLNVHTAWGAIEKRRGFTNFTQNRNNDQSVAVRGFRLKATDYVFSLATTSMNVINAVAGGRELDYNLPGTIGEGFISMEQYGNVVYIGGGANSQQKIYANAGVLTRAQIGIAAPTVALTVVTSGTPPPLPIGIYSYRYTYWNSVTGTESGPGPETLWNNPGPPGSANLSGNIASADAQVTHVRIYRKLNGTDSTWYFVAQLANANIPGGTPYNDNDDALSKTLNDVLNLVTTLPPTQSYFLIAYKDRMWWRDDTALSANQLDFNDMVVSEFGRPEQVNVNNRFRFGNAQNDGIVGGIAAFGALVIWCKNSIWMMVGDGPQSFSRQKIVDGVGCLDRDTIRADPRTGKIYFCDKMGVFSFDGARAEYLSHNVQDLYRQFDQTLPMSAGFDTRAGLYIVTGSAAGFAWTRQLVLDTATGNWFVWMMDVMKFGDLRTPQNRLFMGGRTYGGLNLFRGTTGDVESDFGTTAIAFNWESPKIDGLTTRRKIFRYISVAFGDESASETLTLKTAIDDNAIAGAGETQSRNGKPYMRKWTINKRADSLQFELSGSSAITTRVMAIDIDAEQVGHR